jgi:hypothetical protein
MRSFDKPLPGDLVIRCREERRTVRHVDVWVITHWPDAETVIAGPYQSYGYAFQQARRLVRDQSEQIWRDHARPGHPEELEHVG